MKTKKKKSAPTEPAHTRKDDGNAFIKDPEGGPARVSDDLAEMLAEGFVGSATSGEEQGEEGHELVVEEERGGPFVISRAGIEFAEGVDASNPTDAEAEPFPNVGSTS